MKRWLSLVLVSILALSLCVPALAAEELTEPVAPLPAEAEEAAPEVPEAAAAEQPEEPVPEVPKEATLAGDEPMAISSGTCGSGVTWDLTGTTLTISGTGSMSNYSAATDRYAPWYKQNVTTVVIESGVTSIGNDAFIKCGQLTSVTIPSTVTSIGDDAFGECGALTSVRLPEGLETIGASAFTMCTALTSIAIPSTVTSIGDGAFEQCRALQSVSLPNGLEYLGNYAFLECTSLQSIAIPDTVTTVGAFVFNYCYALTTAKLSSGMWHVDKGLFAMCRNLRTVTVPGNARFVDIVDNAFEGCEKLESITIPSTVTEIGASAFHGCASLQSVTIPASVETIGGYAFADCTSLSSVTIASASTVAETTAFENTPWRDAEGDFVIEDGYLVAYQGPGGSVTIPSTVTAIGSYAFADRTDITAVTIPSSVSAIDARAFMCAGLTSVTVPAGVTTIGYEAFLSCASLERVSIPSTVTDIGERTFFGCRALTDVTIAQGVKTIWAGCFRACTSLTRIVIPSSVTSIGEDAFAECTGLKELVINGVTYTYEDYEKFSDIQPPAGGTGWRYVPQTGDYYYFKDGVRKGDYWVGFADGASAWANNWYYADASGKLLTGLQYLDDLKGGKAWYMLQTTDDRGEIGKMLTGWQWTYSDVGTGYFSSKYGSQGMCTWTEAWGSYNAATGLWGDGSAHRGS